MLKSKVIFALPYTNGSYGAGTRRRSLIVAKTLKAWGYDVEIQTWGIPFPVIRQDAIYVFEMHNLKQWWGRLEDIQGLRYIVDIPESIITAQQQYLMYASWPKKLRHLAARAYYKLCQPDPLDITVEILRSAAGVICASPLQGKEFSAYNAHVAWIWDTLLMDEYNICRVHRADDVPTLVWEGGGSTLFQLKEAAIAIHAAQRKRKLKVIVVTDPVMNLHAGGSNLTVDYLKELNIQAQFVEWSIDTFAIQLTQGCIGIAPLAWRNKFYWQKGANKVQVMNALGLPVIASKVPAYQDWVASSNAGLLAADDEEWCAAIDLLCTDWEARRDMGQRGAVSAWQACSPEAITQEWLMVLEAL